MPNYSLVKGHVHMMYVLFAINYELSGNLSYIAYLRAHSLLNLLHTSYMHVPLVQIWCEDDEVVRFRSRLRLPSFTGGMIVSHPVPTRGGAGAHKINRVSCAPSLARLLALPAGLSTVKVFARRPA